MTTGWTSARLASASMHSSMLIPNVMHLSIRCCTCDNHRKLLLTFRKNTETSAVSVHIQEWIDGHQLPCGCKRQGWSRLPTPWILSCYKATLDLKKKNYYTSQRLVGLSLFRLPPGCLASASKSMAARNLTLCVTIRRAESTGEDPIYTCATDEDTAPRPPPRWDESTAPPARRRRAGDGPEAARRGRPAAFTWARGGGW